jgi:hypothetical protein
MRMRPVLLPLSVAVATSNVAVVVAVRPSDAPTTNVIVLVPSTVVVKVAVLAFLVAPSSEQPPQLQVYVIPAVLPAAFESGSGHAASNTTERIETSDFRTLPTVPPTISATSGLADTVTLRAARLIFVVP